MEPFSLKLRLGDCLRLHDAPNDEKLEYYPDEDQEEDEWWCKGVVRSHGFNLATVVITPVSIDDKTEMKGKGHEL